MSLNICNLILAFIILLIQIELKVVKCLQHSVELNIENVVVECIQKSKLICDPEQLLNETEGLEISRKATEINDNIWIFCNNGNQVSPLLTIAILPDSINREMLETELSKTSSVLFGNSFSHLVFILKLSKDCFNDDEIQNLHTKIQNTSSQINLEETVQWTPLLHLLFDSYLNVSNNILHLKVNLSQEPEATKEILSNNSVSEAFYENLNVSTISFLKNATSDNSSVLYFQPKTNVDNTSSLDSHLLKHSHHHGILTYVLASVFGGGSSLALLVLIFYKFRAAICNVCGICRDSNELYERLIN